MSQQELGSGRSRTDRPVALGGALVTLVEPHRGHEVAYNRWYERDHFYSGCMIGAWTLAGARFVATRDLKALRQPEGQTFTGADPAAGSYLALYWIVDGRFGDWTKWGTDQVKWLIENDRMFPHRDHVHTLMYRFRRELPGRDDGVPVELALDHRSPYVVMVVTEPAPGVTPEAIDDHLAAQGLGYEVGAALAPIAMHAGAPSDVPRDEATERVVHLLFVDRDLPAEWDERWAGLGRGLAEAGLGELLFLAPFRGTIPGTDTYTDQLR